MGFSGSDKRQKRSNKGRIPAASFLPQISSFFYEIRFFGTKYFLIYNINRNLFRFLTYTVFIKYIASQINNGVKKLIKLKKNIVIIILQSYRKNIKMFANKDQLFRIISFYFCEKILSATSFIKHRYRNF